MKCEKCGKNEATFYYKSNVNGNIKEAHLCADCAKQSEYAKEFENGINGSLLNDFMDFDSSFERMFAPMHSMAGALLGGGRNLFGDTFGREFASFFPQLTGGVGSGTETAAKDAPAQQEDSIVSAEEQAKLSAQREINALKHEMQAAVLREDFEQAAKLRDQIKALQDK